MTKLNVTVNESILVDGVTYEISTEKAAVGDVIRIGTESMSYITDGGFYKVTRVGYAGYPQFVDDDGDESNVTDLDEEPTVFKRKTPAEVKAAPDSITYREVIRKATVGERIKITKVVPPTYNYFRVGDIGTVIPQTSSGIMVDFNGNGNERVYSGGKWSVGPNNGYSEYVVLEPVEVSDEITYEGVKYRKVARNAAVGERIIITANTNDHKYEVGDIRTAEIRYDHGGIMKGVDCDKAGFKGCVRDTDYLVLELTQPPYEPKSGDKVRYKTSGTIRTLDKRKPECDGRLGKAWTTVEGIAWAGEEQFDVIEKSEDAKPADTRLPIGTFAKITGNITGTKCGPHGFSVGQIVKVTAHCVGYSDRVRAESIDGKGWSWAVESADLIRATDEEIAAATRLKVGDYAKVIGGPNAKPGDIVQIKGNYTSRTYDIADLSGEGIGIKCIDNVVKATDDEVAEARRKLAIASVKVGDYVKIIGNGGDNSGGSHAYNNGDVVKVREVRTDGSIYANRNNDGYNQSVSAKNFTALTAAESEAYRKQAEVDAAKRAEEQKWAALGRKVGEYKTGDIVKFTESTGSARYPEGSIATIYNVNGDHFNFGGGYGGRTSWVVLVAPFESLFSAI